VTQRSPDRRRRDNDGLEGAISLRLASGPGRFCVLRLILSRLAFRLDLPVIPKETCYIRIHALICSGLLLSGASATAASGDEFWDNRYPAGNEVRALLIHKGNLYIGGTFASIAGVSANGIVKWDGTNWSSLGAGLSSRLGAVWVSALAASENYIYAGGRFEFAGGGPATNIARWDGTNWSAVGNFPPWLGVRALAVSPADNDLYIGSEQNQQATVPANIFKYQNPNWEVLGGGIPTVSFLWEPVVALAMDGPKLYVGGEFSFVGNHALGNYVAISNLACWNGTNWSDVGGGVDWRKQGSGVTSIVNAMAVGNGKLYVGGSINRTGGSPTNNARNIVSWDGTNWFNFNGGVDFAVSAIAIDGDDVYVAGRQGSLLNCVAKWDGAAWSNLGSGIVPANGYDPFVSALGLRGTDLFVGGRFFAVGGQAATNLSIWHLPVALEFSSVVGGLEISWRGDAVNYVLESSEEIPGTNWVAFLSGKTPAGRYAVTNNLTDPARFLRLRHF
jgi:hypothetical protein